MSPYSEIKNINVPKILQKWHSLRKKKKKDLTDERTGGRMPE
jgi:hypothetical protein